ncbi:hypothetical protein CDN99_12750 [Roseateles aquatilis]|uniref:DUF2946 domain-containing protein n=1 Tax=Roseateles aquatilis TaxID=431061 RepID=A0A246JCG1_9BURK|nr:hypothetical protein [Roseateles aquatilis]OWQ90240.1 hypothetical protein CDN99_12750 [Roseateles aquatilis]
MSRQNASAWSRLPWSRWLVLALLSLTLPLQGALAATMGIEMALMSSDTGAAVMTTPSDCHDMAATGAHAGTSTLTVASMSEPTAGMSGMSGMHHGADALAAMDHADSHDGSDHSSDHHCGICLQCCIGAAMPIAPLTLAAQDLRDAAPALGAPDAPEQSPQPLERPPKTFLA